MLKGTRKTWLVSMVVLLLLAVMVTMIGCGKQSKPSGEEPDESGESNGAESVNANMVITTGSAGTGWYASGAKIAEILMAEIPGLNVSVVEGGGVANLKLVNEGRNADIGYAETAAFQEAITGTGEFTEKAENVMGLAAISRDYLQIVVPANSDIKGIQDFKNKRLLPTKKGWGTEVMMRRLLELYGMTYDSIREAGGNVSFTAMGEMPALVKDGHADIMCVRGAAPLGIVLELEASSPIRLIPIDKEKTQEFASKYPGYIEVEIPANTYKGQTEPVLGLGIRTILMIRKDLPEDLVYKITKAMYEHRDEINNSFPDYNIDLDETFKAFEESEIHPGALKYYKEISKK